MATAEDLTRFAFRLPEVEERPHFERSSFRVALPKGKIFATLPKDGLTANLMLTREQQDILCAAEPTVFSPLQNKWGEKGATLVALEQADAKTLLSALVLAWKNAAPDKHWALLETVDLTL